jgi:uncharacterized protein with HEPN domain
MSGRSNELLIQDILSSGKKVMKYTDQLTFEDFIVNELVIDAVVRNLEIIG